MFANLDTAYRYGIKQTQELNIPEIEIRMLICYINGYEDMSKYYLHLDDKLIDENLYISFIERLKRGEPTQYIIGKASFLGDEYFVNKDVLIPRMETEEVVLKAESVAFGMKQPIKMLDLCCGSGCIGIYLSKKLKTEISFLDISEKALDVTRKNCELHRVKGNFILGDLLENVNEKFDLIVSNPPYIVNKDEIDIRVINYEPKIALFPKDESVENLYKRIFKKIPEVLNTPGSMVLEIGYDLKDKLEEMLNKEFSKLEYEFIKDINGKYRILVIKQ